MNFPATPASKPKQLLLYPNAQTQVLLPTTDSFCCFCSQHGKDPRIPDGKPADSHESRGATDAVSTGGPTNPGKARGSQKDAGGEDTLQS